MANNNKIVNYDVSNFNFNKKSNVRKLEKMSKRLDDLQNTKYYSVTFKEAIENKDIYSVNQIYSKANEINERYKGSITNTASFRTMKNRQKKNLKYKKINELKGIKTSGYNKADEEAFTNLTGELFKILKDEQISKRSRYYASQQVTGFSRIIENTINSSTGNFVEDMKRIQKEAKSLNISLKDKAVKDKIYEVYKKYSKIM